MAYGGNSADYKIPFRSDKHRKILGRLLDRIRLAESAASDNRERWKKNEQLYSAYVDLDAADKQRQGTTDRGRPEYVTLYVPYAYAMTLSAHTYICSTLFSRDPVWQYQGRHGEAEEQVQAMEALIAYQVTVGGHLPDYYVWTHDSLRYGFGVIGAKWCKEMMRVRRFEKQQKSIFGIAIGGEYSKEVIDEIPGYEGNRTYNIRPAEFGWDPRYPAVQFQKGEFCTRRYQINRMDLIDKDTFFNQESLREAGADGTLEDTGDSTLDIPRNADRFSDYTEEDKNFTAHDVYVRLIPSEWGLGKGDKPERWYFIVLGKSLIVCARPMDSYSNMWPFAVAPGEVEGYDRVPRSLLETTEALNNTLGWLLNSHMYNVRAALNNQFVVDPSRVILSDMVGPNPGKIIRLRPTAYGSDVRTIISQLPVTDITRANVSDMEMVASLLQRTAGINDNMMGQVNSGRRTATETRSTNTMGISRMKTLVEYQSACAYSPFSQLLVQNSQQYYSSDLKLRIVGDMAPFNPQPFINVTPESISGFYDLVPVDGTMPVDKLALVNTWQQFLAGMAKVPQVFQQYDIGRIFAYVAQLAGLRNVKQFRLQVLGPGMAPPNGAVPVGMAPSPNGMMPMAPGMDNSGAPVMPQIPGGMGPVG